MIDFTTEDWERIKETYESWWNGQLNRPILKATIRDKETFNKNIPLLLQSSVHRLDLSPIEIIERINFELEHTEYLGDAFPFVSFDSFGPGVIAAFTGADLHNETGNVWFDCKKYASLSEIHLEYNRNNIWFQRLINIYLAGINKWQGNVIMGMVDLGGTFDILASLRGTQNLLVDIYDQPVEFIRVTREIQNIWYNIYQEINDILLPTNRGYSDWSGLYSSTPAHIIQCDFSCMISPRHFNSLIFPLLQEQIQKLNHTIYHLDGKGSLKHLDKLLSIPELDAIQWVSGAGEAPPREWLDIYRKIKQSGKLIQVLGQKDDFLAIANAIGAKGLYYDIQPLESCEYLRVGNTMNIGFNEKIEPLERNMIMNILHEYEV